MPNIKTLSAVVGGGAIVAMGALAMAVTEPGGTIVSDPGTFTSPVTSEMTTGETTKSTAVEPTVTAPSASPPVTATTPAAP
ncbi:hypothetical protein [Mycobacterium sp. DL592]|uniref:hypothetical protein n=1 Tax=Mycobacterium sp. DL592 TaxID=2675524 RepID=UPI001423BBFC|nr:hypothetical protein [Mycobacterium sp. DL592]